MLKQLILIVVLLGISNIVSIKIRKSGTTFDLIKMMINNSNNSSTKDFNKCTDISLSSDFKIIRAKCFDSNFINIDISNKFANEDGNLVFKTGDFTSSCTGCTLFKLPRFSYQLKCFCKRNNNTTKLGIASLSDIYVIN